MSGVRRGGRDGVTSGSHTGVLLSRLTFDVPGEGSPPHSEVQVWVGHAGDLTLELQPGKEIVQVADVPGCCLRCKERALWVMQGSGRAASVKRSVQGDSRASTGN